MKLIRFSPMRAWRFILLLVVLPLAAAAGEFKVWVLLRSNGDASESVLTLDPAEKEKLTLYGWQVTATGMLSMEAAPTRAMVNRMVLMSPVVLRRLVLSQPEVKACLKEGYILEGAMGYASLVNRPHAVMVRRYLKNGREIWLSDSGNQRWAENTGWKGDDSIFWLLPER